MSLWLAIAVVIGFFILAYLFRAGASLVEKKVIYGDEWEGKLKDIRYEWKVEPGTSFRKFTTTSESLNALARIIYNLRRFGVEDIKRYIKFGFVYEEYEEVEVEDEEGNITTETERREVERSAPRKLIEKVAQITGDSVDSIRAKLESILGVDWEYLNIAVPTLKETLTLTFSTGDGEKTAIYTLVQYLSDSDVDLYLKRVAENLQKGAVYHKKAGEKHIEEMKSFGVPVLRATVKYKK